MAHTDILCTVQDGFVYPNTLTLAVVVGDSFTISPAGGDVGLLFSSDLLAAVSAQPPAVLTDGQSITFTFASEDPGGYFIAYGPVGFDLEMAFPSEISTTLHLQDPISAVILPPPPPPPHTTTPPKGGTGPVLNPQGAD